MGHENGERLIQMSTRKQIHTKINKRTEVIKNLQTPTCTAAFLINLCEECVNVKKNPNKSKGNNTICVIMCSHLYSHTR